MVLNIWDIFHYIFKWKWMIAVLVAVCVLFSTFYVATNQSYSAEIVISYTDPNMESGYSPNGEVFDVYEIIAPSVISAAISELEIPATVSAIRNAITITPIIPQSVRDLQESKTENGEEYTYYPTDFSVKYTVGSDYSGGYARDVLEAVMKAYNVEYAEKYLNTYVLPRADFDLSPEQHDYIEIAEIMKEKADETIEYLEGKVEASDGYRSPKTGYTFSDVLKKYQTLKEFDISALYANIFAGRVTQDREVLLKKYAKRVDDYGVQRDSKLEEANLSRDLMDRYVSSSTKNPSTSEGYKTDSQNVNEPFYSTELKPDQATYDDLVMAYANAGVEAENLNVSSDYCNKVIEIFSSDVGTEVNDAYTQLVNEGISTISAKMQEYYDIIDQLARDYNSYSATQYIVNKSSVNITTNVPFRMHLLVSVVAGLGFGIILAVAIEVIRRLRRMHGIVPRRQLAAAAPSGQEQLPGDMLGDGLYGDSDEVLGKADYPPDRDVDWEEPGDLYNDDVPAGMDEIDWESEEDVYEGGSFDDEEDDEVDGLSAEDYAAMEDIKDYSHRPSIEYDPEKHYKWPEGFAPDRENGAKK